MTSIYSGHCQCGEVKFQCQEEPVAHICCHCADCRQATNNDFSTIAFFAKNAVSKQGNLRREKFLADSGNGTQREKCDSCGAVMFDKSDGFGNLIGVFSEHIQTPNLDAPTLHVWVSSKAEGVTIPDHVRAFEKGLPST